MQLRQGFRQALPAALRKGRTKGKRHTEGQIIRILLGQEAGAKTTDLCHKWPNDRKRFSARAN